MTYQAIKKKKRSPLADPAVAIMLGLGGYGLKRLGDAALSTEDRKALDDLIALSSRTGGEKSPKSTSPADVLFPETAASPDLQGSGQLFMDYIDRATRASAGKLYGRWDIDTLGTAAKKALGLQHAADPAKPATEFELEEARHYPSFIAGPLAAFVHQHRKVALSPEDDVTSEKLFAGTPHAGSDKLEAFGRIRSGFDGYLASKGLDEDKAMALPHGSQMDLLRGLQGWLDARDPVAGGLKSAIESRLAERQLWSANAYSKAGRAGEALLQDLPRLAGYAAMAAGAGLGGYWLYKKLKKRYGAQETQQGDAR